VLSATCLPGFLFMVLSMICEGSIPGEWDLMVQDSRLSNPWLRSYPVLNWAERTAYEESWVTLSFFT